MVREADGSDGGTPLVRSFGVLQLTMISVGATLGTGILVILGESVSACRPGHLDLLRDRGLAALPLQSAVSYAEMAAWCRWRDQLLVFTPPWEGMAWICGWCLVLEYAVSVAAVAVRGGPICERRHSRPLARSAGRTVPASR